jgi:hypothetical protein
MAENFIESVRLAGTTDPYIKVVRIANAAEIGNLQEKTALPTPGETYRNVLFRLTTDNKIYYLNAAGDGWLSFGG